MPVRGACDYASRIATTAQRPVRSTIVQVFGQTALVWDGSAVRESVLAGRLKPGADKSRSNQLAVGDEVTLEEAAPPRIISVAPRRTCLERASTGSQGLIMQVVAANAEQAMIVSSLDDPPFRPGLVDRWTLLALRGGMEPVLCMNKVDLGSIAEGRRVVDEANIPLETNFVSATTGEGLPELRARLAGRSTIFVGHSGVGKSSLLRCLLPDAIAATGALSERTRKGRHTTSSSKLFPLPEGGLVIDTPGVRSVVLGAATISEVAAVFPEISDAPACRFQTCSHRTEPGCAVLDGLAKGSVPQAVYRRYRKLLEEVDLP